MTIDITINGNTTTFGKTTAFSNENDQLKQASEFVKEALFDVIWGKQTKLQLSIEKTEDSPPPLGIHVADEMKISEKFG